MASQQIITPCLGEDHKQLEANIPILQPCRGAFTVRTHHNLQNFSGGKHCLATGTKLYAPNLKAKSSRGKSTDVVARSTRRCGCSLCAASTRKVLLHSVWTRVRIGFLNTDGVPPNPLYASFCLPESVTPDLTATSFSLC